MDDLSVKKQDKALIHARRARNIRAVLIDPKDTAIESAQFRYVYSKPHSIHRPAMTASNSPSLLENKREICHFCRSLLNSIRFWVKKMFKLQPLGIGNPDVCD